MLWLFVGVAVVAVLGIAAVVVGREAFRLGHQPPATIVDVDEAVAFIAEGLAEEPAGRLTFDEVRELVHGYLRYLRRRGVSALPGEELPRRLGEREVVIDDRAVAAVLGYADERALEVADDDVLAVLDQFVGYLASVGALGPPAGPGELPPPEG